MWISLTSFLLVGQFIALIILLFFLINAIINLWSLERWGKFPALKVFPKVSILIPARNEEENIKKCVNSLLMQDYPNFEILVLDDNSTDKTWKILSTITHEKLKIFRGQPLPEDWLGKHWACHQLEQKSSGELLLFTDADTFYKPHALHNAISAMMVEKADFVSAIPKEEAWSWGEALAIPIIPWSLSTFIPMFIAKRSKRPVLSATIGQFMLFRKEAYNKIGGYPAIRYSVLDDVTFGRKVKAFGLKWRMYDGSKEISCRMYRNFQQVLEGLNRYIFAAFKNNLFYFCCMLIIALGIFFSPFLVIFFWKLNFNLSSLNLFLAFGTIIATFLTWVISNRRFGYPFAFGLIYPIILGMVTYAAFSSIITTYAGKATWKGRILKNF